MLSESDLQHFADTSDELLAVALADGTIVAHNAAWTRLLGHDAASLRATRLPELTTADARSALVAMLGLAAGAGPAAAGAPRLVPLRAADDHMHTCQLSLTGAGDGRVYVRGRPVRHAHTVTDGSRAALLAQVIDTAPFILWQIDRDGVFVLSEGGGLATLGLLPGQVVGMSAFAVYQNEPSVVDSLRRGLNGEEALSKSQAGDLHFANFCRPLRDEHGAVIGLMGLAIDVTAQAQAEAAVREQADRLARQQELMQVMGTPILQVWDGVLCVPVIGAVDAPRADAITEAVLSAVTQRSARMVILDLTGMEDLDSDMAMHFVRIVSAVRLLGARPLVVGIRPAVAQTLVELGVELRVDTLGTLQDALRRCVRPG